MPKGWSTYDGVYELKMMLISVLSFEHFGDSGYIYIYIHGSFGLVVFEGIRNAVSRIPLSREIEESKRRNYARANRSRRDKISKNCLPSFLFERKEGREIEREFGWWNSGVG